MRPKNSQTLEDNNGPRGTLQEPCGGAQTRCQERVDGGRMECRALGWGVGC